MHRAYGREAPVSAVVSRHYYNVHQDNYTVSQCSVTPSCNDSLPQQNIFSVQAGLQKTSTHPAHCSTPRGPHHAILTHAGSPTDQPTLCLAQDTALSLVLEQCTQSSLHSPSKTQPGDTSGMQPCLWYTQSVSHP